MCFPSARRQLTAGLLALLCCALWTMPARAEPASEQAVKAGFIYNFIKFTQWGPTREAESDPLKVCTTADKPLAGQFARLHGRTIGARMLEVRNNVGINEWNGCDMLFIADSDSGRLDAILRSLGNAPVLTVGDFPGFSKAGGMIGLRMEDSRVRFDVNLASAQRAGLTLNSQMLKLAGQVMR